MYAIQRRLFLGGAFGTLALKPPRTAQADTPFTSFSFAATGAPTARTMPDRLSDVINVKEFGALGDHSTNDGAAIQAAIDYCIGPRSDGSKGGTLFFPEGTFLTDRPLQIGHNSDPDIGICILGSGRSGTLIGLHGSYANPSGFAVFSKGSKTYDCIERIESITFVQAVLTRTGVSVVSGNGSVDASNAIGAYICVCAADGSAGGNAAQDPHGPPEGSYGFAIGTGGTLINCRGHAMDIYYMLSGDGASCIGCSTEGSRTGIRVGWTPAGAAPARGCVITGFQTEKVDTCIDLYDASGCLITGNLLYATVPATNFAPASSMTWSSSGGGTVTVNTPAAHNIPAGTRILRMQPPGVTDAWIPSATRINGGDQTYMVTAISTGPTATSFTYTGVTSNPGASLGAIAEAWSYPSIAALRCRKVHDSVIMGNDFQHPGTLASIDLDYGGASDLKNNVFISNDGARAGWLMPTNANSKAGCTFIACGGFTVEGSIPAAGGALANPMATLVFANLPNGTTVQQPGPMEGQEYDITDGQKEGGSTALFDDAIQGGGSQHIKVRYNASSAKWRRIG
jgi:hypothetical protein